MPTRTPLKLKRSAGKDEINEIVRRLYSTHTKSSAGSTECKSHEPPPLPGFGQKMLPAIPNLEERFSGRAKSANVDITKRLHNGSTRASSARLESPRILLWPERTLLMNDVQKIREYNESGSLAKQGVLPRREKWFI